jgi:hypothetical protein
MTRYVKLLRPSLLSFLYICWFRIHLQSGNLPYPQYSEKVWFMQHSNRTARHSHPTHSPYLHTRTDIRRRTFPLLFGAETRKWRLLSGWAMVVAPPAANEQVSMWKGERRKGKRKNYWERETAISLFILTRRRKSNITNLCYSSLRSFIPPSTPF